MPSTTVDAAVDDMRRRVQLIAAIVFSVAAILMFLEVALSIAVTS